MLRNTRPRGRAFSSFSSVFSNASRRTISPSTLLYFLRNCFFSMAPLQALNGSAVKDNGFSALRSVKRDWSDTPSQPLSSSQSSVKIDWPSSPPRVARKNASNSQSSVSNGDSSLSSSNSTRSSYETRVQAVQAMLDAAKKTAMNALNDSSTVPSKRHSSADGNAPVAKKRTLPSSWSNPSKSSSIAKSESQVAASKPAPIASSNSFASSSIAPRLYVPPAEESATVASIFLSHEQQHILKLVQEGHNVFFTGSAGT